MEFRLNLPPFVFQVHTNSQLVVENSKRIYPHAYSETFDEDVFVDYRIGITSSGGLRSWLKPQVKFTCDNIEPFKPLPANHGFAMLEWGMNLVVANHEFDHIIVHSAVLAKDDIAIMFPAPPGSGKSTLTAHLANNGWRLLSDEMALIIPNTSTVVPFVRAICLKNESINLAKQWFPNNTYSSIAEATHKGNVIHMSPNVESTEEATRPATLKGIVFPQYKADTELEIYQLNQTQTYMQLVHNAFNFKAMGKEGFDTITQIIEQCKTFEIHYNSLDEIDKFLEEELINPGRG